MAALALRLLFEALVLLVFSTVFANIVQVWLHGRAKVRALRGVSGPPSKGFLFGNLRELLFSFGCGPAYNAVAGYGGIVKVEGLFGVRLTYLEPTQGMLTIPGLRIAHLGPSRDRANPAQGL